MRDLEQLLRALSDRTRLRLLNLMREGELCVCYLVETLGEAQPKISRHLAYLRKAGVVESRRDGKWIHYKIVKPRSTAARQVLDAVLSSFEGDRDMERDRALFSRLCCSPRKSDVLRRAPRPQIPPAT